MVETGRQLIAVQYGTCAFHAGYIRLQAHAHVYTYCFSEETTWEDLGVDGSIILRWIFRKWDGDMDWINLAQVRDTWRALFININQLDALNFIISLFSSLYMFRVHVIIVRRAKLYYTVSGIITPIGGCTVHGTTTYRCDDTKVV